MKLRTYHLNLEIRVYWRARVLLTVIGSSRLFLLFFLDVEPSTCCDVFFFANLCNLVVWDHAESCAVGVNDCFDWSCGSHRRNCCYCCHLCVKVFNWAFLALHKNGIDDSHLSKLSLHVRILAKIGLRSCARGTEQSSLSDERKGEALYCFL